MGDARRRGTFENRRTQAIERKKQAYEVTRIEREANNKDAVNKGTVRSTTVRRSRTLLQTAALLGLLASIGNKL